MSTKPWKISIQLIDCRVIYFVAFGCIGNDPNCGTLLWLVCCPFRIFGQLRFLWRRTPKKRVDACKRTCLVFVPRSSSKISYIGRGCGWGMSKMEGRSRTRMKTRNEINGRARFSLFQTERNETRRFFEQTNPLFIVSTCTISHFAGSRHSAAEEQPNWGLTVYGRTWHREMREKKKSKKKMERAEEASRFWRTVRVYLVCMFGQRWKTVSEKESERQCRGDSVESRFPPANYLRRTSDAVFFASFRRPVCSTSLYM